MYLEELQEVWDDLARADPLWAVLSDPAKIGRRWDIEEFFETGRQEIKGLMDDLAGRGIRVETRRCLDFGCGVGRLTRALAGFFAICDGVDISPSMIRQAEEFNKDVANCRFSVNERLDLALFANESFDLIYSNIVLQHIRPELSEQYIREFVRLLTVDGVAVFQVPATFVGTPSIVRLPEGSHRATLAVDQPVPPLSPNDRIQVRVVVENRGDSTWPRTDNLRLGNHWLAGDGRMLVRDDGRSTIPRALPPGQRTTVDLTISAPEEIGRYILELDMVEEGASWFGDRGSVTARIPVSVSPPSRLRRLLFRRSSPAERPTGLEPRTFEMPRMFEMHGLPRDRVVAAVMESGGRFLDVVDYNPAGEDWESFRYYVTK